MNKLAKSAIALWIITIGAFGYFFIKGSTQLSTDNRMAIQLNSVEKDLVLGEMRTLLTAINGVLIALGQDDMKKASVSAKSAGMAMAVDVNPVLMAKLPIEFKKLGMSLHSDFDYLSSAIDNGLPAKQIIQKMGEMTNKCIACHSTYRFGSLTTLKESNLLAKLKRF